MHVLHSLYPGVCGNRVYFKCIVAMYNGGGVVCIHPVPHGIHILPSTHMHTLIMGALTYCDPL